MSGPGDNPFDPNDPVPQDEGASPPPPRFPSDQAEPPIFQPINPRQRPRTNLKIALAIGFMVALIVAFVFGAKTLIDQLGQMDLTQMTESDPSDYGKMAAEELAKERDQRDYKLIYEYLVAAARSGSAKAMETLGVRYRDGVFLHTDKVVQEAWFRNAAGQGSTWAQYVLGYRFMTGSIFEQDFIKAERWLKQAAEGGSHEAALYLGGLYFHPKYGFERKDLAFPWFLKAGQAGIKEGQYLTALGYSEGWGGKSDGAKAKYWTTLAEDGSDEGALSTIAYLYYNDQYIPQNYTEAAKWYKRAAKTNSPQGLYDLASLYETGQGVKQDYQQALELYRRSAKQGFKPAIYALGHIYRYGTFGTQDLARATDWLEKGAALQHPGASYMLGRILEQGLHGGEPQLERALELYDQSCEAGERIGCAYAAILRHNESMAGGARQLKLVEEYYGHHCNVEEQANQCYNLGCILALLGRKGEALTALEQAVRFGYDEFEHMEVDEDLNNLRNEPRFLRLKQ